jgi:integrase
MGNVRFNLKNKKEKSTLILMIYRYDGNRLVYSTGEKIAPSLWNDKEQLTRRNRTLNPYANEVNSYLKKIEAIVLDIHRSARIEDRTLGPDEFKIEIEIRLGKRNKPKAPTLFEFISSFIKNKELASMPKGSIQVYQKSFKHLLGFSERYGKIDFQDIDIPFLEKYKSYLFKELNFSQNYGVKIIQNLKLFLNEATEQGLNKNMEYKKRKFKIKKENPTHIYLTMDEIQKIASLNLPKPYLERVRDLFLIGCYTGLRFSDLSELRTKDLTQIEGQEMIEVVTRKTRQKVVIPMHPLVKAIIIKNGGRLPRSISNQRTNIYLKQIGELAGLYQPITRKRTIGGNYEEEVIPKWKMLSTHTARRSFATNSFKAGVPSLAIMKITGHTTEQSFMQYIKVSEEENALLMAQNDFFLAN